MIHTNILGGSLSCSILLTVVSNTVTATALPNKLMNIAIATVLGMMVSVGLVFVLEFLDRTYKTPTDIERHLGLSILGAIPDIEGL